MYLINPLLTNDHSNSKGYNDILSGIDNKIMCLASIQYENQVLGYRDIVDMGLYDTLCVYREIIMDKLMGCTCGVDTHMIYIIQQVKKLTK